MPTDVPFHALGKPRHLDPGYHTAKQQESETGDTLWDRIVSRCPKCHTAAANVHESCGHCGFEYEDFLMLLDRVYLEVNALGGTPFDGPYNTAVGDVLTVLRRLGAIDVETERR